MEKWEVHRPQANEEWRRSGSKDGKIFGVIVSRGCQPVGERGGGGGGG